MSNILSGSGSGIRDIEHAAIRPWRFASLARHVSSIVARPAAFAVAVLAVLLWAASGPFFEFSDT